MIDLTLFDPALVFVAGVLLGSIPAFIAGLLAACAAGVVVKEI